MHTLKMVKFRGSMWTVADLTKSVFNVHGLASHTVFARLFTMKWTPLQTIALPLRVGPRQRYSPLELALICSNKHLTTQELTAVTSMTPAERKAVLDSAGCSDD